MAVPGAYANAQTFSATGVSATTWTSGNYTVPASATGKRAIIGFITATGATTRPLAVNLYWGTTDSDPAAGIWESADSTGLTRFRAFHFLEAAFSGDETNTIHVVSDETLSDVAISLIAVDGITQASPVETSGGPEITSSGGTTSDFWNNQTTGNLPFAALLAAGDLDPTGVSCSNDAGIDVAEIAAASVNIAGVAEIAVAEIEEVDTAAHNNFPTIEFTHASSTVERTVFLGEFNWDGTVLSGADTTAPTVSSASVNTAGDTLTVTFDETLAGTTVAGDWTLNGTSATVASTSISGTDVTLTLSGTVYQSETVTLDYAGTGLDDAADNQVATFTGQAVTNNSTQTAPALTWSDTFADETETARASVEIIGYFWDTAGWAPTGTPTVVSQTTDGSGVASYDQPAGFSNNPCLAQFVLGDGAGTPTGPSSPLRQVTFA